MSETYATAREDDRVFYEATIRVVSPASRSTHFDPAEAEQIELDEAWRTVEDGPRIKLRPDFLPEDVQNELLAMAKKEGRFL